MRPASVLTVLLAPALLAAWAGPVQAHVVWSTYAELPVEKYGGSAAHDDRYAYLFGNHGRAERDGILRYEFATDAVVRMSARLVAAKEYTAAVQVGPYAYVFGGADDGPSRDVVQRYDPATDTLVALEARIPTPRERTAVVHDPRPTEACPGGCVYLFGGLQNKGGGNYVYLDDIVRFDPASGRFEVLPYRLPAARFGHAAVFDGERAYLFGGQGPNFATSGTIFRFDPATGESVALPKGLPSPRWGMGAVWNGTHVLLFGGRDGSPYEDEIFVFDTATETLTELALRLPTPRWGMMAAPYAGGALLFGGYDFVEASLADVLRYHPRLRPPPTDLDAASGDARGSIALAWPASPDATVGYRIDLADGTFVAEVPAGTTSFVDTGLPEGVLRAYRVRTVTADGAGPPSVAASAYPAGLPSAPLSPKARPGGAPGEVRVAWSAPEFDGGGVTAYRVYGGDAPGALAFLGEVAGLSFVDQGVPTGATRHYEVSAVNAHGEGPRSVGTSGSPPRPPAGVAAKAEPWIGGIKVSWSRAWDDGGLPVTHYAIFRGRTPSTLVLYDTASAKALQYVDEGRSGGVQYYYQVAAVNAVGEGPRSKTVTAFALAPFGYKVVLGDELVLYDDRDDDGAVDDTEAVVRLPRPLA